MLFMSVFHFLNLELMGVGVGTVVKFKVLDGRFKFLDLPLVLFGVLFHLFSQLLLCLILELNLLFEDFTL